MLAGIIAAECSFDALIIPPAKGAQVAGSGTDDQANIYRNILRQRCSPPSLGDTYNAKQSPQIAQSRRLSRAF
jgi:hypothetical protein